MNDTPDSEPPHKWTLDKVHTFLKDHWPALTRLIEDLKTRGLKLVRFHQSQYQGRMCGSLKFSGLPEDYILQFALQRSEDDRRRWHEQQARKQQENAISSL